MSAEIHRQSLSEEATHVLEESRMVLPGVQAILGFQLIAAFNQRFNEFDHGEQMLHYAAFFLVALAMALIIAPATYHRQAERGTVSRRFLMMASGLLTMAMAPLALGICLDAYLLGVMILGERLPSLVCAGVLLAVLVGLWYGLPAALRYRNRRELTNVARERGAS
jgi:hypothetical protein